MHTVVGTVNTYVMKAVLTSYSLLIKSSKMATCFDHLGGHHQALIKM
jgi:hypothetical protein